LIETINATSKYGKLAIHVNWQFYFLFYTLGFPSRRCLLTLKYRRDFIITPGDIDYLSRKLFDFEIFFVVLSVCT